MSEEPPTKKVRKGTRSCLDCRHRKVRCVWESAQADACQNCILHGRQCTLQEHSTPTSEVAKLASRSRIERLEIEVSSLRAALQRLEPKVAHLKPEPALIRSETQVERYEQGNSESENSEVLSTEKLPTHLGRLFDNTQMELNRNESIVEHNTSRARRMQGSISMTSLLPCKEDMIVISSRASSWVGFQKAVFPKMKGLSSGANMLSQYEHITSLPIHMVGTDPIAIAALLLSVVMTLQHAFLGATMPRLRDIRNVTSYIKEASDAVETHVIYDDFLASSLEGIEMATIFLRVQLASAKLRKTWLFLRRLISLAELTALPRASAAVLACEELPMRSHGPVDSITVRKASAWEVVCTIERIFSVVTSLPIATSNYRLPKLPLLNEEGGVNLQAYIFQLAGIASRIVDLDMANASGKPPSEQADVVATIDQELRYLSTSMPPDWWQLEWSEHRPDATMQCWHEYLTIRTHFQLGLTSIEDHRFDLNFEICLTACQNMARRYISLRPLLAPGFFANPVFDLQCFSAAIFLILASHRAILNPSSTCQVDVLLNMRLIDSVISAMTTAYGQGGAPFAQQSCNAIKSLRSVLERPNISDTEKFSLHIPLVGKVHVSRRSLTGALRHQTTSQFVDDHLPKLRSSGREFGQGDTARMPSIATSASDPAFLDALSFSMEFPDSHPLVIDELLDDQDWLTWSGWGPHA